MAAVDRCFVPLYPRSPDNGVRCVSERDVERYPDGQSYGESQLESMKQTQHTLMHLSDQTHRLRRREFNVEEAREALKLVHSEECAEQILTYIIEAENLSTRIFQADTEADRVGLSQSKTMAEKKPEVTSANSGAAMHPQDLSSEPVNLSEEQGSDTIARAMRMIASSLQMLQQEETAGGTGERWRASEQILRYFVPENDKSRGYCWGDAIQRG